MFLLKEEKSWFDNYSRVGKEATQYFKVLMDAKNNIGRKPQKNKTMNTCHEIAAFESLEKKKEKEEDIIERAINEEDNKDIFNETNKDNKKNNRYINQKLSLQAKYKYHNRHLNTLKKKESDDNPSCTKYNPKYTVIRAGPKLIHSWEKQSGRKSPKIKESCDKFYLEHDDIMDSMAGSAFIDMSKQSTKRQSNLDFKEKDSLVDDYSFINNIEYNFNNKSKRPVSALTKENTKESSRVSNRTNIVKNTSSRINSTNNIKKKILKGIMERNNKLKNKNLIYISNISEIKQNDIININDLSNNNISLIDYKSKNKKRNIPNQTLNSGNSILSSNLSNDMYNKYYLARMKKIRKTKFQKKNKQNSSYYKKSGIKAPDFSRNLSRESLDKLKESRDPTCIPYLIPKYSFIREKPIMLVSYKEKSSKHKIYRNQSSKLTGVNYSFYYDADKAIKNANNYTVVHPPNFDLMTSRPIDDNPLPSYMKKIVDKFGLSEFSLKMNNYKNRDFSSMKSSFFPKKSFNKVINLNLLKSKKFFGNIIFGECKKKFIKKNPLLNKIIRFYNRNFETILNERYLKQIDNVTFKGIRNDPRKLSV